MARDDDNLEFIEAVCLLAELSTSDELRAVPDDGMDALILAARFIKTREGYAVVTMKL